MTVNRGYYETKGYDLKTEIQQITENKCVLKVMKTYHYDDIWEARNAYERFWRDENDNKRIVMIGDTQCMVVTFIEMYEFSGLVEAEKTATQIKQEYKSELSNNQFMRDEVLTMIANYDDLSKQTCYLQQEMNRVLDMKFEDLGMSHRSLMIYHKLRISCARDFIQYTDELDKMRKEGFFCPGKPLTRKPLEELINLLKKENMEWVLIRTKEEEEEVDLPFK